MSAPVKHSFLDTALELLSHAIGAEEKHDYPGAYAKYMTAIDHLMAAQQCETDDKSRGFLKMKTDEYLDKAVEIRRRADGDASARKRPAVLTGGASSATDMARGDRASPQSAILDEAFRCAKQAIEADAARDLLGAYTQYMKCMDYFMFAQRYVSNEQSRTLILSQVGEYLSRAESIKEYMDAQKGSLTERNVDRGPGQGPPRAPEAVFLQTAIEITRRAVQQDTKGNYRSAFELYNGAFDYFMLAHKHEKNEPTRVAIRANMEEYLARAEAIKKLVT